MDRTIGWFPSALCLLAMSLSARAVDDAPVIPEPNPYEGKWLVAYPGASDSELTVTGRTGTYKVFVNQAYAKNNPCLSLLRPVEIRRVTAEEIEFFVNGSALKGCGDFVAVAKRTSSNTLTFVLPIRRIQSSQTP